ncbi:DnaJ like protein subfamily C member 8 [Angomonas deanei]|nr:DnaJ like protein subfamily C member 8 [Angomonas deanei]|eukprot:EPY31303.1 DnaJ like protein subfamily C member 8 [Angomonas deanei]
MAKSLHPDKCTAEGVKDAFIVVEKAYRELSDEKKLVRYKAGFEQQRKRQAAEAARQGSSTGGFSGVLSDAERKELALKNMLREQQLRSARLAEEEDRKRERDHQKKTSEEELNVELKRQKKEWDSMKLF